MVRKRIAGLLPRLAAAACLALLAATTASVQEESRELADKLRAAFLYNFAKFVEWPAAQRPGAGETIRICVLRDAPFATLLASTVAGKQVGEHALEIIPMNEAIGMQSCHLAYFSTLSGDGLRIALNQLGDAAVLSVHEHEQALSGGVVRFYLDERRMRFEINRLAAEQAGLKLSAKLMGLAKVVER